MNAPRHALEQAADGRQRRVYDISEKEDLRTALHHLHKVALEQFALGKGVEISLQPLNRQTAAQRAHLNALCGHLANGLEWHGQWLSKADWRHLVVAAYRKDTREVEGLNGGLVLLGGSSRDLNRQEASDVIEMVYAFAAEREVKLPERPKPRDGATL